MKPSGMRTALRYRRKNCRPAGFVTPEVGRMFKPRPYWPVVRYDPEFAAFQRRHHSEADDYAMRFFRLKQAIKEGQP